VPVSSVMSVQMPVSVCPRVSVIATGQISVKFDVGDFNRNLSNQNLVKIGQKYQAHYIKT
jgi:hypothetical protein